MGKWDNGKDGESIDEKGEWGVEHGSLRIRRNEVW